MQKQTIDKVQQVKNKAAELYKYMDWKEFDEDRKRVIITAEYNTPIYEELLSLIRKVSDDTNLSDDSVYAFTMDALGMIADSTAETEDELQEVDIEADVYTSSLTAWLNENNYHVEYLTEVLEEYGAKDGYALLTMAQGRAKEEVFSIVLNYLTQ